jgi:hypothetical protein
VSIVTPQGYRVGGEWRELFDFPNYAISDDGRVMNVTTGQIKNNSANQTNVAMVNFSVNGDQFVRSVAVLVAQTFLDRAEVPDHFDTPIHLDGDRGNCRADNLAWRPRWFAVKYHQQFKPWEREKRHGARYPVELIETGEVFETSWEAAIKYGMLDEHIFVGMTNNTFVFPHGFHFREAIE